MTTPHGFSTTKIVLDQEGTGERTEYMRRWIFSTPLFTLRLHHILDSDYGPPHNHPWNFLSLILKGGYTEHLYSYDGHVWPLRLQRRKCGSLAFRRATDIHKVRLIPGETAWTLCVTSGAKQTPEGEARWGFFTDLKDGGKGYIPWQVYDPNATEDI